MILSWELFVYSDWDIRSSSVSFSEQNFQKIVKNEFAKEKR